MHLLLYVPNWILISGCFGDVSRNQCCWIAVVDKLCGDVLGGREGMGEVGGG